MNEIHVPFLDWNGNGQLDVSDIATTLAINESRQEEEDENDDVQ